MGVGGGFHVTHLAGTPPSYPHVHTLESPTKRKKYYRTNDITPLDKHCVSFVKFLCDEGLVLKDPLDRKESDNSRSANIRTDLSLTRTE